MKAAAESLTMVVVDYGIKSLRDAMKDLKGYFNSMLRLITQSLQ